MSKLSDIKTELSKARAFWSITGTLEEISSAQLVSLRLAFEQNSLFYEEISQLYYSIKLSADLQKINIDKPTAAKPKTAHVAITSNHHFYGTLNADIMSRFYEETSKLTATKVVIGSTGKEYLVSKDAANSFEAISFEKDSPTDQEIQSFLRRFHDFDRIFVYYPKFVSMLSQKVDVMDITHSPTAIFLPQSQHGVRYIFEPELPKIVEFFETQVRFLLFSRVMLETDLSRTACRLVSMNVATIKAKELIAKQQKQLNLMHKASVNAELIEMFGRISVWKRT